MALSRQALAYCVAAAALALPCSAEAQSAADALTEARELYGPPPETEPCTAEQDAAAIAGEIVVCRRRLDQSEDRLRPANEARSRYAAATIDAGDLRAPDLAHPHCNTKRAGCIGFGWVPPRAIVTDFAALPEAPPGSNADRIARGLAPLGEQENSERANARIEAELGLPPPDADEEPPNPP